MAVADPENLFEEHHHHEPFIAHHFESAEQQFDSGKLGIWIFLVTEVLFLADCSLPTHYGDCTTLKFSNRLTISSTRTLVP